MILPMTEATTAFPVDCTIPLLALPYKPPSTLRARALPCASGRHECDNSTFESTHPLAIIRSCVRPLRYKTTMASTPPLTLAISTPPTTPASLVSVGPAASSILSAPQMPPVDPDVMNSLSRDIRDDLGLNKSSPAKKSWGPVESEDGASFTTSSLEEELLCLEQKARQAALKIQSGVEAGPISLGWATMDMYERLVGRLSSAYRLSWGLSPTMEVAEHEKEGSGSFGQVLFWGDPSPMHEQTIEWLHEKVSEQLKG
ncbi:hypothetical protein BCV69DRAFT_190852 [Microstroma glucosiphilum]|uniref:Uncharacterized protein n=1 Tax=Pseudomicrostroma glucosiphilum TaxID=1684307 RepID=A0A316UDS4_9BASI|nr:hypothetical protein BCV69DRAFT_190852 [Pseudomicrostroma glucosiphilum]PWN21225.1 hypothetical protein BCV69DRAFT_190852 [Pseudomicrostroma glucosiphilum]